MISKGSYNIRCKDGLKPVNGYIYTTFAQGEPLTFGITQSNDGWYIITELSSGMIFPVQTNINLMATVSQLKVFLARRSDETKGAIRRAIKNMGELIEWIYQTILTA